MTQQIPAAHEETERLRGLISQYEVPPGLTAEQRAGEACVWCALPPGPEATVLDAIGTSPTGCPLCYTARLIWLVTWYDWMEHAASCGYCQQRRQCAVDHGRRLLHQQTLAAVDKPALSCSAWGCLGPILPTEMARPVLWTNDTALYLGYAHTRCQPERGAGR